MTRPKSPVFSGIAVALVMASTSFVDPLLRAAAQVTAPAQTVPPLDADLTPFTSKNLAGHRLWVIVFDKTSMQSEDIQRVAAEAVKWNNEKTPNVDVVAVAVINTTGLELLQDFTTNDAKIERALAAFSTSPADAGATRLAVAAPDLDALSDDTRSSGLRTICDTVKPWRETKEILYFTAGAARGNADSQGQYRDAVNACEAAHVTIDSIDARGLTVSGRGAASSGRGAATAASARGGSGSSALAARAEAPPATRPDFSGTWQCDPCPVNLLHAPEALWLGPMFKVSYAPTDAPTSISFQAAPLNGFEWTFNLAGSESMNVATAPLAGNWVSTLSWAGDTLVLTMTGTVQQDGKAKPVVTQQVLSFVTADGATKGDLEVVTRSAPSGVLPDGVCRYKRIGRLSAS
jgi:VWFA-related protein